MNDTKRHLNMVAPLVVVAVVLFSFFSFSYLHYPFLNSDDALNILMTHYLDLPGDLYYWGQDRAGNLIPVLAWGFHQLIGFDLVFSVSLAQYLVILAGFLAFSSFIKNRWYVVILAVFWFLPNWHMLGFLFHPFGLQVSLLGIALFLVKKYYSEDNGLLRLVYLSLASGTVIAMVWVSDLALISLLIAAALVSTFIIRRMTLFNGIPARVKPLEIIIFVVWAIAGIAFIWIAKQKATRIEDYNNSLLNSPAQLIESAGIFLSSLGDLLFFRSGSGIEGVFGWLVVLSLLVLAFHLRKMKGLSFGDPLVAFLLLNALAMFIVVLLSNWVFLNGTGRRYFTLSWMLSVVALVLWFDRSKGWGFPAFLVFMSIGLTGALSSVARFYYPEKVPSRISVVREFRSLGESGIIAEYWNAYVSSAADPGLVKATPHDADNVRNHKLVDLVFEQPRIFLIKDWWLDEFPDTITQFGYQLVKKGNDFFLGGSSLCEYSRTRFKAVFYHSSLQFQGRLAPSSSDPADSVILVEGGFDMDRHIVYGPFIGLPAGRYTVKYRMGIQDIPSGERPVAWLDVSRDYGKSTIASANIYPAQIDTNRRVQDYELSLMLRERSEALEFRVLAMENCTFLIEGISVIEE